MPRKTYYILDFAVNTKETGPIYPQVQKMSDDYDMNGNYSIKKLSKYWNVFPDFSPDLENFVLHARSNLTDFLSNALTSRGMIVSEKIKTIFQGENIHTCPIKFYKSSIKYKKEIIEGYYWMHIISDYTEFVDYTNSNFFISQNFVNNLGYIKISSKKDLLLKEQKLDQDNPDTTLAIWAKKFKMLPSFNTPDFFKVGKFDSNYYISDILRKTLEDNQVSGYSIKEAHNLII